MKALLLLFLLFLLQILSVSSQVRPVRSHPQGDPDRLPLHQPGQGEEEQAGGDGGFLSGPQPQQLLHQLRQLGGFLCERTAEPSRTGKVSSFLSQSGLRLNVEQRSVFWLCVSNGATMNGLVVLKTLLICSAARH